MREGAPHDLGGMKRTSGWLAAASGGGRGAQSFLKSFLPPCRRQHHPMTRISTTAAIIPVVDKPYVTGCQFNILQL